MDNMNPIFVFLLIAAATILILWVVERSAKAQGYQAPDDDVVSRKGTRRFNSRRRFLRDEETFPDYDRTHDDELNWRTVVEPRFRTHLDYPPDWQRRRALVFIRDRGKCQGKEHRGGTCGRLLCEPNQIWHFAYDVRLLVDAHVDHIKRISFCGDHDLTNLQLFCARCHSIKH